MEIPYYCPRKRPDCIALDNIIADDQSTFFCCGENNGEFTQHEQDRYTVCFKGPGRDDINHYDKRDLIHHSSVMIRALAVIEKCHDPEIAPQEDWSPWGELA